MPETARGAVAAETRALLSGNEAITRGAWEAGVRVAAGYPGTPSTEILESLASYEDVDVRWSTNEKVALDVALGASLGGARALATMKHVGLNVAADTFLTAAYSGVGAGLVLVSADDPGMHSSQNEQDNRPSHSRGLVELEPAQEIEAPGFQRDPQKYVMLPTHARARRPLVLERLECLATFAEESSLTVVEERDPAVGVVTAGIAYQYVREVLPQASVLKLGLS